jgi:hypothetical protein
MSDTVLAGHFSLTKEFILSGRVRLQFDTLKCVLLVAGWTPNDSYKQLADVEAIRFPATGSYPYDGMPVVVSNIETTGGFAEVFLDSIKIQQLVGSVGAAIIYADTTVDGYVNPLLAYAQFPDTLTFERSTRLVLSWPASIFRW